MYWHSRMWAGAVVLCALAFATNVRADTVAVVPADPNQPVVVVTPAAVPEARDDEWSVFTGHGAKGGHMATVSLGIGEEFAPEASYRFFAANNLAIGLRLGWAEPFVTDDEAPTEGVEPFGLRLALTLTTQLMRSGRWSLGFDVSPGIDWEFKDCSTCHEVRVATLYLSLPLLYSVVPGVFSVGASVDVLTGFNFQPTHVTVDFPLLVGGIAEYHVSRNFALTAEAKFGGWFNTFVSQQNQPVFLISRFSLGLAFYGVP